MPSPNYRGKGNVLKFQNELRAEVQKIVDKGFPGGVEAIAVALVEACGEQVKAAGLVETGTLADSFTAAMRLDVTQEPGVESARAALQNYEPGDQVLVYTSGTGADSPFYGWFWDQGFTYTNGRVEPARQFMRAAVEAVDAMAVKV